MSSILPAVTILNAHMLSCVMFVPLIVKEPGMLDVVHFHREESNNLDVSEVIEHYMSCSRHTYAVHWPVACVRSILASTQACVPMQCSCLAQRGTNLASCQAQSWLAPHFEVLTSSARKVTYFTTTVLENIADSNASTA